MANSDLRCICARLAATRSAAVGPDDEWTRGDPGQACIWAVMRDINGNSPSSSSAISTPANLRPGQSPPALTLSTLYTKRQHAGGKAPDAHWRRSGVCRRLEKPQWPLVAGIRCLMQLQRCDMAEPYAPTINGAQAASTKDLQALSTRRVPFSVFDRFVLLQCLCQAMTPITPLEPGMEMFERGKAQSFFSNALSGRSSLERPLSHISVAYTDIEDDSSEFEEFSGSSSDNRRSQTTISTLEEVTTPGEEVRPQFAYWPERKSVEGPKGPHLFRASQSSNEFQYEDALQLSPLLPKEIPTRQPTSFREATPETIVPQREYNNIALAVAHLDNAEVRAWTSRDVATWMYQNGFEDDIIDKFIGHDITGAVLLDLQFDDLKELEIQSFGKRHQLWHQIDSLRTAEGLMSPTAPAPIPTPFEDIERPCTEARNRSKSKGRKASRRDKSRGRNLADDVITPAHSVSIVAIEQLLPKPHVCAKGERCSKWKKQQRQLARLKHEHGFPISPEKGGHIFIAGDPGNAQTATHAVENVHRPNSDAAHSVVVPSVVASSDVLGPGQLPDFTLQDLQKFEQRDPQDNVRQFLTLQGQQQPFHSATPVEAPPTPPAETYPPRPFLVIPQQQYCPQVSAFSASTSAHTTRSFDPFAHTPSTPALHPPEFMPAPHSNLKSLPKLTIPPARSMSAQPIGNPRSGVPAHQYLAPESAFSPCRTASPGGVYRFGTPFSEMDVPVTAVQQEPLSRDTSQSVPPNMQYQPQIQRSGSRHHDRRRPSLPMPALAEDRVFSPTAHSDDDTLRETIFDDSISPSNSASSSPFKPTKSFGREAEDTVAPLPKGGFQYKGVNHHGWMKKRRTKLLRHEWQDHHFRLQGTTLAMHPNELPSSSALQTIDVDDYAVACSSLASSKLSSKLKALKLSSGHHKDKAAANAPAFEFQLVPTAPGKGEVKKVMPNGKVQHFAVTTKDQRIDWMRELMLAKALKAKNDGYEVNVNGANM
ncbi:sam and ph domain-containing protein [Stemphylium lycopersici]|uniref:Sam and ph domain-containing protein n=1 Tax=Stemphylium lycopersici TaxID=183478 RepID=A0A364NFR0_STELY|nr:sam and ph domain-containing protein [Stemphylium lycopersici]